MRRLLLLVIVAVALIGSDLFGQARVRLRIAPSAGGGTLYSDTWTQESTGWTVEGVVFDEGQMPAGSTLAVDGVEIEGDCLATYADTSCFHGVYVYKATSTGSKAITTVTDSGGSSLTPTWPSNTYVDFTISATTYTATLPSFDSTHCSISEPHVRRCWVLVQPVNMATPQDSITVKLEVTTVDDGGTQRHKVGYSLRNIENSSDMNKYTTTTSAKLDNVAVSALGQSNWVFHSGTMWYRTATTAGLTLGVAHQTHESWIAAHMMPRIVDQTDETYHTECPAFTDLGAGRMWGGASCNGIWAYGISDASQINSDHTGRDELTPISDPVARYLVTHDETYRTVALLTAQQSGGFTNAIDKNGDGDSILRIDEDGNDATVTTYAGQYLGLGWPSDGSCVRRGVNNATCSTSSVTVNETGTGDSAHLPESNYFAYLTTGEVGYLDNLRHQAAWAIFAPAGGAPLEYDPDGWPGYERGRMGARGELNSAQAVDRAFGRPLRVVWHAAAVLPDSLSTDRAYFRTITNNNLEAVARYMDYLASKGWDASPYLAVGITNIAFPGNQCDSGQWQWCRYNSITATTANTPGDGWTRLTVIGDDSGVGTGINDHDLVDGDCVTLSGFTVQTALNVTHNCTVDRIDATHFDINIDTSANTSSEGQWLTRTGPFYGQWHTLILGTEVASACLLPFFTCSASTWGFVEKVAARTIALTQESGFAANAGYYFNAAVTPGVWNGDTLSMYASFSAMAAANEYNKSGSALLMSESQYAVIPPCCSESPTHHRGIWTFDNNPVTIDYAARAIPLLAVARQRGVSGAATAYTALLAATGVVTAAEGRPGFYWGVP